MSLIHLFIPNVYPSSIFVDDIHKKKVTRATILPQSEISFIRIYRDKHRYRVVDRFYSYINKFDIILVVDAQTLYDRVEWIMFALYW